MLVPRTGIWLSFGATPDDQVSIAASEGELDSGDEDIHAYGQGLPCSWVGCLHPTRHGTPESIPGQGIEGDARR